jgi:1-acyl-sn-glycerol-3-phosphate acyltransferase
MAQKPDRSDPALVFNVTPPRPGVFSRTFPSFFFYTRMLRAIVHAERVIKAGRGNTSEYIKSSLDIARAVNSVGGRIAVENADVLRSLGGPCIIAANHMSSLETMLLEGIVMPIRPMTLIAKESLMKYPFFSTPLKACDPIIVGRKNPREDLRIMTSETHERITRGISVVVFPQTTRTNRFSPEHFNSIGAKLAKRENVPLVPLALKTDFWGCGRLVKDVGHIDPKLDVRFRFGEPIGAAAGDRDAHQRCLEFIGRTLEEWGAGKIAQT